MHFVFFRPRASSANPGGSAWLQRAHHDLTKCELQLVSLLLLLLPFLVQVNAEGTHVV